MTKENNGFGMRSIQFFCLIVIAVFIFITPGCGEKNTEHIRASGTIEASELNVHAESGGKIVDVKVAEGIIVKEGDILGNLDSTIKALQVQQAEAALKSAQEKSKETRTGSREQMIAQAEANLQQITALRQGAGQSMENAGENLARIEALYNEGGTTIQQLSDARTRYETAKAQYEAYSAQISSARENLDLLKSGATQETINIADAGVAQAQAGLSIAKNQLDKTVIYSSIDGIVSTVNFQKGEYVNPGAAVFTIIDMEDLWVNVYITEKDLPKVKLGQKAEIYIDAYPDKPFSGQVSYISPKSEFTPKNLQTKEERVNMVFKVKINITGEKENIKPGLPADIKILTH